MVAPTRGKSQSIFMALKHGIETVMGQRVLAYSGFWCGCYTSPKKLSLIVSRKGHRVLPDTAWVRPCVESEALTVSDG